MKYLVFVLVSLFAVTAAADTYKWIDEKGVVSYADDLGKVPKRFRGKAIVVDSTAVPVEIVERTEESRDTNKAKASSGIERPGGSAGKSVKAVYGGKDEESWRKEFAKIKADIKGVEEFLAETKARLKDTEKLSRSEYISLQNTVKDSEIRLASLRSKLEALTDEAIKAKVPNELR